MSGFYCAVLQRDTDITITLPDGQTLSEIILTPWVQFSYWSRIFNMKIELYNDAGDMIRSHLTQEFTDDTPYTGPVAIMDPSLFILGR